MKQLPSTFCWTKMGTESGEDLTTIIQRKEWERQLGGGHFLWGIGQSLGDNAKNAAIDGGALAAVFSPMPSKPKAIDVTPGDVVLWNSWIDADGCSQPLPAHAFVTSRATLPSGRRKESHYALVCCSESELLHASELTVSPYTLRNAGTGRPLGASQVTAVVSYCDSSEQVESKSYPVSFAVALGAPYFVRLADPSPLSKADIASIAEASANGDISSWDGLVARLRGRFPRGGQIGRTLDMFEKVEESTMLYRERGEVRELALA